MAESVLTAVVKPKEDVSEAFADISQALREVANDAPITGESLDTVQRAADKTEQTAKELNGALDKTNEDLADLELGALSAAKTLDDLNSETDEAIESQSKLSTTAEATQQALDEESQSFKEAFASANSLEEAKSAASKANKLLSETASGTKKALNDEMRAMVKMAQSSNTGADVIEKLRNENFALAGAIEKVEEDLENMDAELAAQKILAAADAEELESLTFAQGKLGKAARNTSKEIDEESASFKEAFAAADSLEEAKDAASKSNEVLSETAKSTRDALNEEMRAMVKMAQTTDSTSDFLNKLRNSNLSLSAAIEKVEEDFSEMNPKMAATAIVAASTGQEIEGLVSSQTKLSAATNTTTQQLEEEATTFKEAFASAETLAEAKNAASTANTKLSATAKKTKDEINEEVGAMFRMANSAATSEEFVESLRNSNLMLAQAVSFTEEQIENLSAAQLLDIAVTQIHEEDLEDLANQMEEVADEAQQAAISIAGLGGAFSSTSINLGPFNFALRRAAVQIPQLVITTGALSTSLLGLASAAGIAGGALAGIFAGGLIAKADRVAASSSDIEGRLEAIEEIAGNVRDMFIRALEPLIDSESINIFEVTIESLATSVNLLAQVADNLQNNLVAAGNEVANAFGENTTAILTEMENTVEAFLPLIVDLIVFFANGIPNALRFFQDEGVKFTKTLGELGTQLVGFFTTFTEVGIPILEGVITAIRSVLEVFETFAEVINTLPDGVLEAAFALLFLTRILDGVLGKSMAVGMFFSNLGGSVASASGSLSAFNNVLGGLQLTGIQRVFGNILKQANLLPAVFAASSDAAQESMSQFSELGIPDNFKELSDKDELIDAFSDESGSRFFDSARQKLTDLTNSVSKKASGIKNALVSPFTSAKNSIVDRFRSINEITDDRSIVNEVARSGPLLPDDQIPEDVVVDTKTSKARRKIGELGNKAVNTGKRIKDSLTPSVDTNFGIIDRLKSINEITGDTSIVSDVARSGPTLTDDKMPEDVVIDTKTARARRKIEGLGEKAVGTGKRIKDSLTPSIDTNLGIRDRFDKTISPAIESTKDRLLNFNNALDPEHDLTFYDIFRSKLSSIVPSMEDVNDKVLSFTDTIDSAISPTLESANNSLLNFTDALDPNQDLTFYDILRSKVSSIIPSTEGAKSAILGIGPSIDEINNRDFTGLIDRVSSTGDRIRDSLTGTFDTALDIQFRDSGMPDTDTGKFSEFSDVIRDRVSGAFEVANESILTFTDGLQNRLDPSLDNANDKLLSATDSIDNAISPALESANDSLLNFTDALDPDQDLTFYDIFRSKVSSIIPSTEGAKSAILSIGPSIDSINDKSFSGLINRVSNTGDIIRDSLTGTVESALNVRFEDSGMRDMNTGRYSEFSKVIRNRVSGAFEVANESILSFTDGLQNRLDPSLDNANDKLLSATDSIDNAISPALESANDSLLNFTDALDPDQDLTFYDMFRSKVSSIIPSTEGAKSAILGIGRSIDSIKDKSFSALVDRVSSTGDIIRDSLTGTVESALNVRFEDSGMRDMNTGRYSELSKVIRNRVSSAFEAANESILSFTDGLQNRLDPSLDNANDKLLSATDRIDNAISPALESANDRLLNFTDALDPDQDLTFYDVFRSKLSSIVSSTEEVKSSILGIGPSMDELNSKTLAVTEGIDDAISPALESANERLLNFTDALDPDQDLTFYEIFEDKISVISQSLENNLGPPLQKAKERLFDVGETASESGDKLISSVTDVDGYGEAIGAVGEKAAGLRDELASVADDSLGKLSDKFDNVASSFEGGIAISVPSMDGSTGVQSSLDKARKSIKKYTKMLVPSTIATMGLTAAIQKLGMAPLNAIKAIVGLAGTLITQGTSAMFATIMNSSLAKSLASVTSMGIPVISKMTAVALTFLGVSASAGVATGAVAALSLALDAIGIGLIIKAFVALIAVATVLAGVLSNIGGVSNAVGGAVSFLKGIFESLFNFLLAVGVPTWNVLIDVLEVLGAFIFPFIDAFDRLGEKLGFANEEGSAAGGVFDAIGSVFMAVGEAIGFVIGLLRGPLSVVADIIYASIAVPLFAIVDVTVLLIDLIDDLIDSFMQLPIVQDVLSEIDQGVKLIEDAFDGLGEAISQSVVIVESLMEGMVNSIIDSINSVIRRFNNATGDQFDVELLEDDFTMEGGAGSASERLQGAEADAQTAKENAASMTEEDNKSAKSEQPPAQKEETNNYENNEYNFGDFNMNPEEKARVKGLVQSAIREANREKRFRDGTN